MKIWEIHSRQLGGVIETTPEGEADVCGLLFSEKAYFLALRDFRPAQIVDMVRSRGPNRAAQELAEHFEGTAHGLLIQPGLMSTVLRRSDEQPSRARGRPRSIG